MKRWLAAAATVFGFGIAAAQWAQEPQSVIGVQLGKPLGASSIPACPPKSPLWQGYPPGARPTSLCAIPSSTTPGEIELYGVPDLGFEYAAAVLEYDGVAFAVVMRFPQIGFESAVQVLSERYGRPTASTTSKVSNAYGATVDNRIWQWRGQRTTITATERAAALTASSIYFADMETAERFKASADAKAKAAASKL